MKTNLLKWLALLSLLGPITANAAPIIYDVSRIIGSGSVMGTITTDGTLGALNNGDITAWDLDLFDGADTFNLNSADADNGLFISPDGLFATVSGISFDFFSTFDAVNFLFNDPSVLSYEWLLFNELESLTHTALNVPQHVQQAARTGVQQIATAQATGLTEPGTLGLALIGLAGLVLGRKRKQRQAAAV